MLMANAQSLTPAQTAALQQQLDNAKAQLVQLQMQEGQVPAGDNNLPAATVTAPVTTQTVTPTAPATSVAMPAATQAQTMTLSATDAAQMNTALTALAGVLKNLQSEIAGNPQFLATNGASVVATLKSIGNTVAMIGSQVEGGSIAMTAPQTTSGAATGNTGIAAQTAPAAAAPTTPTVTTQPNVTQPAPTTAPVAAATTPTDQTTPTPTAANTAPLSATASSFSLGKLNWPLIIVIILIVAAIAIWLWWDDGDEKSKPVVKNVSSQPSPQRPTVTVQSMNSQMGGGGQNQPSTQQTPMSAAMANQQKKTA